MTTRTTMTAPDFENLHLERYPSTSDKNLRAWNAADEYLTSLFEQYSFNSESKILIINDQFGAISCSLSQQYANIQIHNWTDSFLSKTAIEKNLERNKLPPMSKFVDQCSSKLRSELIFDYVFIRTPKHNSLLEFQLNTITSHINLDTVIVATGMTKEIHNSTTTLFENIIGPTKTSLAKKKARLVYPNPLNIKENESPINSVVEYKIEEYEITSYGFAGVFSREKLDIGSRVLLKHLPETTEKQKLMDLGCGAGILGTIAAKQNPSLNVSFSDESFLAIESAKMTFEKNTSQTANYFITDVLEGVEDRDFDHILCNPPFHQQNVQTLSIANKMFRQSARKLKSNGELRVVANRHLKYRPMLNQYFKRVKIISDDPKFVVWLAKQPIG